MFRPEFPNVNAAGSEKQLVLNHCCAVPSPPTLGSHETLGRCAGPVPIFATSVPRFTVNGDPDCSVQMPVTCQPLASADSRPLAPTSGKA